ncbi:MAG: relaxase domain-containing protein [Verrucomicrobiales bacterium]|nr:relaxase domain-containing protein [Verrucomicrobiales bacterium]
MWACPFWVPPIDLMFSARPQKNLKAALEYFRVHLQPGDGGVSQGQGAWIGKGLDRLGIHPGQPVTAEMFDRLCHNRHPITGEQLTALTVPGRRIFFDFVVSAPKSVSIMALTVGDARILQLHEAAVRTAVARMEQFASTRVRKDGKDEDRVTGELVAILFQHACSRALDPQLHTHLVVFNATWDPVEKTWKALQTGKMFEALSYCTEVYRSELAAGLKDLGYRIRNTRKGFEIEGVSLEVIRKFSKRAEQIDRAEEKLAKKLGAKPSPQTRMHLAQSTRGPKLQVTQAQLLKHQQEQLTPEELAELNRVRQAARGYRPQAATISTAQALDYARDHLFERRSTVERHELLQEALKHGRGDVRDADLRSALERRPEFITVEGRLTTKETLRLERELIAWVNQQAGRYKPFAAHVREDPQLSPAQNQALLKMLWSTDGVTRIGGGAGTGKTHLLTRFVRTLRENGHDVFVCAPTTQAVDVLRRDGFVEAQTLQRLLADETLQLTVKGKVLLVDEASLLSVGQMHDLFSLSKRARCRVVLSGDIRQHHSVEAGDSLRVLAVHAQLHSAQLDEILRQKPKPYREAVDAVAAGRIAEGYSRLNRLGAIVEAQDHGQLIAEYVDSVRRKRSTLIVSPTWREITLISNVLRERLAQEGVLQKRDHDIWSHSSMDWTLAQRRDLRNYRPGLVLTFQRSTRDFRSGEWAKVLEVRGDQLVVQNGAGRKVKVSKKQALCFDVSEVKCIPVAPGERLLIQGNCRRLGLINGQIVTVSKIDDRGHIHLTDGRKIDKGFRSFTYGYCVTSHAAQGKTVDHVYLAVSSKSFLAASREQFYVSVSRGRYRVRVFTDDKRGLLQSVQESSARLSAVEMVKGWIKPQIKSSIQTHVAPKVSI